MIDVDDAAKGVEARRPMATASPLHAEAARAILRWIVRSDLPAGRRLKERELGDLLHLSRSPVRAALGLLEREAVVTRREQGGYVLARPARELADRYGAAPEPAVDELYRAIATAWFSGEIPQQVSTAEILRRFRGGAGDVGRALGRLAEDGIIVRTAGKGWRLGANLGTARDFADSYRFRETVEPAAIILDSFSLDEAFAARVRRRHERILAEPVWATVREMADADIEFHGLIAASCGNAFFAQAIDRQNVLRRLVELLSPPDGARLRASCREHLGILAALEERRQSVASALMREHLGRSVDHAPSFRS